MFSATVVSAQIVRACGHSETEVIRYSTIREMTSQKNYGRRTFCKDCKAMVKGWLEPQSSSPDFTIDLPPLIGSDKEIKWAISLRDRQSKTLLPAMSAAAKHGGKVGEWVWQAIYAVITQRKAKFWIDNRELGFDHYYIISEAEYFAMGITYAAEYSNRSVYGRMKKTAPYMIKDVQRRCQLNMPAALA